MAMWHEEYLGKPWAGVPNPPESFTCGELVRYVYAKDYGYSCLPVPVPDAKVLKDCVAAMNPGYFGLIPVEGEIRDKDAVFLSRRHLMDHCGLGVKTPSGLYILHCSQRGGVQLSTVGELRAQGYTGFSWWRRPDA